MTGPLKDIANKSISISLKATPGRVFKSVILSFFFIVLGQIFTVHAEAQVPAQSNAQNETKSQLHIPWQLINSQLKNTLVNASVQQAVPDQSLTVSDLNWNLSGMSFQVIVPNPAVMVNATSANVSLPAANAKIHIGQLSINQIIQKTIDGIPVRIQLQGSCGPIDLAQSSAQGSVDFGVNWSSGSPVANLQNLTLSWPANSWVVSNFTCTGPNGFADTVQSGILQSLQDASAFKSQLQDFIAQNLQSTIESSLNEVREVKPITVGSTTINAQIGNIQATSTGLVAQLLLGNPASSPVPDRPVPTLKVLQTLSQTEPSIIGGTNVIDQLVNAQLAAQPAYFVMNLNQNTTFEKLLGSRFLQFFVWSDLLHYPENSPFYLQIQNPQAGVSLSYDMSGKVLTTPLPVYAMMQSFRDNQWWNYVSIAGPATANVTLTVANGVMTYSTTLSNPTLSIQYTSEYSAKYQHSSGLPRSEITSAVEGHQSAMSGTIKWPDVDFGLAGAYRASGIQWIDANTFVLQWANAPVVTTSLKN